MTGQQSICQVKHTKQSCAVHYRRYLFGLFGVFSLGVHMLHLKHSCRQVHIYTPALLSQPYQGAAFAYAGKEDNNHIGL